MSRFNGITWENDEAETVAEGAMVAEFARWLDRRLEEDDNPWGVQKHEDLLREAWNAGFRAGFKQGR